MRWVPVSAFNRVIPPGNLQEGAKVKALNTVGIKNKTFTRLAVIKRI